MRKRVLSIVLVLALCLAFMPTVPVFAADHPVSTAAELGALTVEDDDTIQLLESIDAPDYTLNLDTISAGSFVNIDLNGKNLVLNNLKIENAALDISSTAGGGTLTVNSLLHSNQTGILTIQDGVTVTVNDTFVWQTDEYVAINDDSKLQILGATTLDYFTDPTDFRIEFDGVDDSEVVLNANDIFVSDPAHATDAAAKLFLAGLIPAQFEAIGSTVTGKITIRRTLPDSQEDYTESLTLRGNGNFDEASAGTVVTTKVYNGSEQDLISMTPTGGDPWYYYEGSWKTEVPKGTTVTDQYTNAGYMVVGDGAHSNSAQTMGLDIGISPYAENFTVTVTGNSQTVPYNGTLQSVAGYTVSIPDGVPFTEGDIVYAGTAEASGTEAGTYYMLLDDTLFSNSNLDNITGGITWELNNGQLKIDPAPVTVKANDFMIHVGEAAPDLSAPELDTHYTVTGLIAPDTLTGTAFMAYIGGDPDTSTAGTVEIIISGLDVPNTNYTLEPFEPGTLTIEAAGGGGGGGGSTPKQESYDFTQPEEGVGSGVVDDEAWTWGERANLPTDTATLYMILSNNAVSEDEENPLPFPEVGTEHFLADEDVWVLPEENPPVEGDHKIETVMVCQDNEPLYFANGDGKVDESTFGNSDFFTVGVGTGDTKIDYPNLKTGDVVTNKTFNGVFVTKLQKSNNPTFDADLAKLKSDTIASFRAFELDHPEVFWLNGSIKLRVLTVTIGGEQTSFIFMTLVDDSGFTMRITEYAEKGAIERGIAQRDAAVAAIIAQIPAGATTREKIVNLNKWFTLNNEYNRSADLSSIGYTPHRSLKSLTGNFGINGPVCDGYSRGFKTVCDRLGIPVILDTGVASIGSHSELHMWMRIKVDGTWYGTDCTWDDPIVKGKDGKVSGYENEKYLLVGNDTVVDGAKFGVSHPANKTPGGVTGVLFANLILNPNEIYGYTAIDYDDVKSTDWFFDYVQDVSARGLMNGTSTNLFSPQGTATRGQIVQILYNIAGQPEVDEVKVDGWFGVPATWAMDKGIVAGYPDGDFHGNDPVTREQLATIIWAFEGAPEQSGTLSFADADKVSEYAVQALLWAKREGIIGGKPGNLVDPQGTATRAEIATIFSNYMK